MNTEREKTKPGVRSWMRNFAYDIGTCNIRLHLPTNDKLYHMHLAITKYLTWIIETLQTEVNPFLALELSISSSVRTAPRQKVKPIKCMADKKYCFAWRENEKKVYYELLGMSHLSTSFTGYGEYLIEKRKYYLHLNPFKAIDKLHNSKIDFN